MPLTKDDRKKRIAKITELIDKDYSVRDLASYFGIQEKSILAFMKRHHLKTNGQVKYEEKNAERSD